MKTNLRPDDVIELEAIVADARTDHLPIDTIVDELAWEETGDDERRVAVLRRALGRLEVPERAA